MPFFLKPEGELSLIISLTADLWPNDGHWLRRLTPATTGWCNVGIWRTIEPSLYILFTSRVLYDWWQRLPMWLPGCLGISLPSLADVSLVPLLANSRVWRERAVRWPPGEPEARAQGVRENMPSVASQRRSFHERDQRGAVIAERGSRWKGPGGSQPTALEKVRLSYLLDWTKRWTRRFQSNSLSFSENAFHPQSHFQFARSRGVVHSTE